MVNLPLPEYPEVRFPDPADATAAWSWCAPLRTSDPYYEVSGRLARPVRDRGPSRSHFGGIGDGG
jgi:hypothetical protein